MGNVIKMPLNNNLMSDEDIDALFLGLIKLVKKQEMEKAKNYMQIELESANDRLKKAIKDIVLKKAQIEKLQSEISLLKHQIAEQKEKDVIKKVKAVQVKTAKDLIGEFVSTKGESERLLNL